MVSMDQFTSEYRHPYVKMQSEPDESQGVERDWIFDQLPTANIVSVSRPDASDISPVLLTYTIEFRYKQVCLADWSAIWSVFLTLHLGIILICIFRANIILFWNVGCW